MRGVGEGSLAPGHGVRAWPRIGRRCSLAVSPAKAGPAERIPAEWEEMEKHGRISADLTGKLRVFVQGE